MAKSKTIPNSAGSIKDRTKTPTATEYDFTQTNPCWRIGHFDRNGRWGLNNLTPFKFHFTEELIEATANSNINKLYDALDALDKKTFDTVDDFWKSFSNVCTDAIPVDVVQLLEKEFVRCAFVEKIWPKLISFEDNTWDEIRQFSHKKKDKMVSNNHFVSVGKLKKEAQERLEELGYSDRSEIYSLRLDSTQRIYGFRELNYLDIIWVDLDHSVYDFGK